MITDGCKRKPMKFDITITFKFKRAWALCCRNDNPCGMMQDASDRMEYQT